MSIWLYQRASRNFAELIGVTRCPFCETDLSSLHSDSHRTETGGEDVNWVKDTELEAWLCPACGWWNIKRYELGYPISKELMEGGEIIRGAAASLREFDLTDVSAPLEEVRAYLVARYEERHRIHPRVFEETVGSVFRDLGYQAEVTAYSGDGGIDVILTKNSQEIGVQVKRYRGKIQVDQIRELAGALLLRGLTNGIFVTTSSFQKGVTKTAKAYRKRGYAIELVDADRFFDALKITQRPAYVSFKELTDSVGIDVNKLDDTG